MVLSAFHANNYTVQATGIHRDYDLQREVDLTERAIRNAANRERYNLVYDARVIGNPIGDIQDPNTALTVRQIAYRDAFVDAGYLVTRDADTGFWRLSWEDMSVEGAVTVYSVRTTVVPGAIITQTKAAINNYLATLIPVVRSRVEFVNAGSGGDINESDFGATNSSYYEYIVIVRQQDPLLDHSVNIKAALTTTTLGYISSPSNVEVYKIA